MHEPSFEAALAYIEKKHLIPLERMLFTQLLSAIDGIRNSGARGEQYKLEDAMREGLNQLRFTDLATRKRYASGVGKYFSELKKLPKTRPAKQVSLVGTSELEQNGQFRFII